MVLHVHVFIVQSQPTSDEERKKVQTYMFKEYCGLEFKTTAGKLVCIHVIMYIYNACACGVFQSVYPSISLSVLVLL